MKNRRASSFSPFDTLFKKSRTFVPQRAFVPNEAVQIRNDVHWQLAGSQPFLVIALPQRVTFLKCLIDVYSSEGRCWLRDEDFAHSLQVAGQMTRPIVRGLSYTIREHPTYFCMTFNTRIGDHAQCLLGGSERLLG